MAEDLSLQNENRSMTSSNYLDSKLDKSKELNEKMTINEDSTDEYTNTIMNIGVETNANSN